MVTKSSQRRSEVRRSSIEHTLIPPHSFFFLAEGTPLFPIPRLSPANADTPPAANPVRKPAVVVHNKGGQIYDETRPSDWDKQRWK